MIRRLLARKVVWRSIQDSMVFCLIHWMPEVQCCGSMTFWFISGSGSGSADPCLWLVVSFLWNFFISREAATAERRYEKERQSGSYMHMAVFSARTNLLSLSPPCPPPPPLTLPPYKCDNREPACALFPPPPFPSHPHEDYSQILATSPKVEDSLHVGACEYGSWIWTAIVIMYEFLVQW